MSELRRLRKSIRDLYRLKATHLLSESVHETFPGQTVWDGTVGVFAVCGHPTARQPFAWSHESDTGGRRFVAVVLGVPPVTSARAAVRAATVAEKQRKEARA